MRGATFLVLQVMGTKTLAVISSSFISSQGGATVNKKTKPTQPEKPCPFWQRKLQKMWLCSRKPCLGYFPAAPGVAVLWMPRPFAVWWMTKQPPCMPVKD